MFFSKNKGLILCFDEKRAKQALRASTALPLKKRNPFTVQLNKPRAASEFRGDHRQFVTITSDDCFFFMLWKYLSLEDADEKRLQNAKHILTRVSQLS